MTTQINFAQLGKLNDAEFALAISRLYQLRQVFPELDALQQAPTFAPITPRASKAQSASGDLETMQSSEFARHPLVTLFKAKTGKARATLSSEESLKWVGKERGELTNEERLTCYASILLAGNLATQEEINQAIDSEENMEGENETKQEEAPIIQIEDGAF